MVEPKLKGDDILRSQLVTLNRKVKPVWAEMS